MTEYRMPKLPAEPDGPVWDKDGNTYHRIYGEAVFGGELNWRYKNGTQYTWDALLEYCGPLTDEPPLPKVGDEIDAETASRLPVGSVFANYKGSPLYTIGSNHVASVYMDNISREELVTLFCDTEFTVLRVGWERSAE